MFNPLVDSFDNLSDNEVEAKISELSRKYFQTRNPQVQLQIANILDMYKEEMRSRNARKRSDFGSQDPDSPQSDLDNLIKVS